MLTAEMTCMVAVLAIVAVSSPVRADQPPDQAAAFMGDPDDDDQAFANLVNRLPQSPHYGERMAQHRLDMVRSFNDDKPYNQFIAQQIAGDDESGYTRRSIPAKGL